MERNSVNPIVQIVTQFYVIIWGDIALIRKNEYKAYLNYIYIPWYVLYFFHRFLL